MVEKPMALRVDHADAMIRVCDAAGVRLFVVKQCRFHVPVMKARAAFEAGRFGKLVMGSARILWRRDQAYYDRDEWRGTWALDGGVLINRPFIISICSNGSWDRRRRFMPLDEMRFSTSRWRTRPSPRLNSKAARLG